MKRITRDKLYTEIAKLFSQRSTCGRLQVGCVITKDGRVIASGYNGPLKPKLKKNQARLVSDERCKCDLTQPCQLSIHAEANAIAFAARMGIELDDTTLYVTHSPCIKCAELIIQSGIEKVVFVERFRDDAGLQLLNANNVEITQYETTE